MNIRVEPLDEAVERLKSEFPDEESLPTCRCGEKSWRDGRMNFYTPTWFTYTCGSCGHRGLLINPPANSFFVSATRDDFQQPEIDYMNEVMEDDLTAFPSSDVVRPGIPTSLTHFVRDAHAAQWELVHEAS